MLTGRAFLRLAHKTSVKYEANGRYRLAPFYDLMCTAMYPRLSRQLALSIGGAMTPGRIQTNTRKLAQRWE